MAQDVRDDWTGMIWIVALLAASHHPYLALLVLGFWLGIRILLSP